MHRGLRKLFRYRGLNENTLRHLEKGEVFFQSALKFNDPFEIDLSCDFQGLASDVVSHFETFVKHEVDQAFRSVRFHDVSLGTLSGIATRVEEEIDLKNARAALLSLPSNDSDAANRAMQRFWELRKQSYGKKFGICCFSEVPDNILMWSHYADNYRGICIVIDPSERPITDWKRFVYEPITYAKERVLNVLETGYEAAFRRMMLTKAACWNYEREWRLISIRGEGKQYSSNRNVLGIILGLRIKENDFNIRKRLFEVLTGFRVSKPNPWSKVKEVRRNLTLQCVQKDPRHYRLELGKIENLSSALGLEG